MKNVVLLFMFVAIATITYSQDKIVTHRGDTIKCKISEIADKSIKYKYVGEDLLNSISKNVVNVVIFGNGRVQKVTDKIVINGEDDWEKVQITNLESDVEGLTKYGELNAKKNGGSIYSNVGKLQKKAIDKLKKEAASHGCHIILMLSSTGDKMFYAGSQASVSGVAYKY